LNQNPVLSPITFIFFKIVYNIMSKPEHTKCDSGSHPENSQPKMSRLYVRENSSFVPIGWYCKKVRINETGLIGGYPDIYPLLLFCQKKRPEALSR
jgi:hypothetical protein